MALREGYDPYEKAGEGVKFYGHKDNKAVVFAPPTGIRRDARRRVRHVAVPAACWKHWHTGSMTRRVPELHPLGARGTGLHAPEDAQARPAARNGGQGGVAAGEIVARLETRGRNKPPVGLIFVPFFDEGRLEEQAHARRHLPDLEGDRLQEMRGEGPGRSDRRRESAPADRGTRGGQIRDADERQVQSTGRVEPSLRLRAAASSKDRRASPAVRVCSRSVPGCTRSRRRRCRRRPSVRPALSPKTILAACAAACACATVPTRPLKLAEFGDGWRRARCTSTRDIPARCAGHPLRGGLSDRRA